MISKDRPKKVRIHITTYAKPSTKYFVEMNKAHVSRNDDQKSRFICSICLNTSANYEGMKNLECDRSKSRSCPMCQRTELKAVSRELIIKNHKTEDKMDDTNTKNVQTSKINVDQGLNLLTEVLTVFQSQKENNVKERSSRTIIMRDACVSTEIGLIRKPKLSVSKIFKVSIEGSGIHESGKFHVVNACQPKVLTNSQCSIDLIKHKSSSIPQMKMEELKNSLKEKTNNSKNAIEEVNRMFATVKRDDNFENINRPLIRNGPRVLPVVKTTLDKQSEEQYEDDYSEQIHKQICKCCQTKQTNYYMSSGDSLVKLERCEKSVNVECCNKNHNRAQTHVCERCRKPSHGRDY